MVLHLVPPPHCGHGVTDESQGDTIEKSTGVVCTAEMLVDQIVQVVKGRVTGNQRRPRSASSPLDTHSISLHELGQLRPPLRPRAAQAPAVERLIEEPVAFRPNLR